ncbi:Uncharacterised protein [Niallia circulans]|nr:Uncharacterised protein [Niallia circulans]
MDSEKIFLEHASNRIVIGGSLGKRRLFLDFLKDTTSAKMLQSQPMCIKKVENKNAFQTFTLEGWYYVAMCSLAFVPEPHKGMTIASVSQCR